MGYTGAPGYKNAGNCTLCTSMGTASLSSCYTGCHLTRVGTGLCMTTCLGLESPGTEVGTMACLGEKIKCLFFSQYFKCPSGSPLDCEKHQIDCNTDYEKCTLTS